MYILDIFVAYTVYKYVYYVTKSFEINLLLMLLYELK